MGVLIIFLTALVITVTYVMLEPTERLKQQLYFFGKFPKGTRIENSPTTESIYVTFPSDEYGTEVWEFDRIAQTANMKIEKDKKIVLEQKLKLNEGLDKFISDRRLSSLFFKLIKTAFMYAWYFISITTILISLFSLYFLITEGHNEIIPYLPTTVVGIILFVVSVTLGWVDIKLYLSSLKNKNKKFRIA